MTDNHNRNSTDNEPRPQPGSSSQLYGKQPSDVHSTKRHHEDSWPLWAKILLFPIYVPLAVWSWQTEFFDKVVFRGPLKRLRLSGFWGVLQLVVGAIVLAVAINAFVFQSYQVVGQSMSPTLMDGDRLLINKLGKTWSTLTFSDYIPARGDIVVFDSPLNGERQLVKRVLGVPGDRVEFADGVPTVFNDENPQGFNPDQEISDNIPAETNYSVSAVVDDGQLFVAGDNRIGGASLDSRNDLGLVPIDNVIGTLLLRILPLSESRFF